MSEQQSLYAALQARKSELEEDEHRLLDVYLELLQLMILRQTDPERAPEQAKKALQLGERNLRLHDAGFMLRNHPHLTHSEAHSIGDQDSV